MSINTRLTEIERRVSQRHSEGREDLSLLSDDELGRLHAVATKMDEGNISQLTDDELLDAEQIMLKATR